MNIFKRLFKIGQAEAHSAVDKLEDPIKLTEQGIRDLKKDLESSLHALAEVKAMAIRAKREVSEHTGKSKDYETKAMLLLKKAQDGNISAEEADRLAGEALLKKEQHQGQVSRAQAEHTSFDKQVNQLEAAVKKIRSNISKWENELKTLQARVKVSTATKKLNKQLSNIDASSTVSMLEKMKDKVAEEEALAESYGEIAMENQSVDDEINSVLDENESKASDSLAALKAKMGLDKKED